MKRKIEIERLRVCEGSPMGMGIYVERKGIYTVGGVKAICQYTRFADCHMTVFQSTATVYFSMSYINIPG